MYKRYDKYKDSGIDWIGEIPEHWSISKIKYQAEINNKTLNEKTPETFEIEYLDIGNVDSDGKILKMEPMFFSNAPSRARRIVSDGDTLVSTVRTYLKAITWLNKVENNLICSTGFAVLSPQKTIEPKYLSYLVRSPLYVEEIVSRSVGVSYPAITSTEIGNLECIVPPKNTNYINEQKAIANYLDHKTSEIDSLIADKEKLIEKFEEYKQSIITEAVTKGLDPNVKMKDSGIEWIGEVPEHWEIKRLKKFSNIARGTVDKSIKEDEIPVYLIQYTNVYYKSEQREHDEDYLPVTVTNNEWRNSKVLKGDILVTASSETPDDIGRSTVIVDELDNHVFGSDVLRIRIPDFTMVLNYKKYLIENYKYLQMINRLCRGVTRFRFGMNDFKIIRYLIPPIKEQTEIADYLDKKVDMIESLKKDTNYQIENLKQYRQSLIYETVTGKIDVREYEPERSEQLA